MHHHGFLFLSSSARHRVVGLTMCSDKDQEIMYGDNGEEMYHIDFSKGIGVMTLPQFSDPVTYPGAYEQSITNMDVCKFNLKVWAKNYNKPEALGNTLASPQHTFNNHGNNTVK